MGRGTEVGGTKWVASRAAECYPGKLSMSRRIQSLVVYALAVIILGGGFFPEAVFCVGDNGHRAFELTPQACCSAYAHRAMGVASRAHGCATGCTDFKLAGERLLSKSADSDLAVRIAAASSFVAVMPTVAPAIETSFPIWDATASTFAAPPRVRHTTVQVC